VKVTVSAIFRWIVCPIAMILLGILVRKLRKRDWFTRTFGPCCDRMGRSTNILKLTVSPELMQKIEDEKNIELLNRVVRQESALAYAARVVDGRDRGMNVSELVSRNVLPDTFNPRDFTRLP